MTIIPFGHDPGATTVRPSAQHAICHCPLPWVWARLLSRDAAPDERRLSAFLDDSVPKLGGSRPHLVIKEKERVVLIDHDEIEWITAAGNYVELHLGTTSYLRRQTLSDLERQIDPARFCRVHRQAIVSITAVREIERSADGWRLRLRGGAELPVARERHARVMAWLDR